MKFIVSTNFQDRLVNCLSPEFVYCLYGKLTVDYIGGGRHSFVLPAITRKQVQGHIKRAHERGLEFNYLLNATCLGNREYTISGQRRIRSLLDWLAGIKVDSVTVSIPYLAQLIKKDYPAVKIHVSTAAEVDSVLKAKYWQEMGVDCITLQSTSLNRDFETLNKIRENVKCKLALIANESCLYKCPVNYYHYTTSSHASQSTSYLNGACVDYCILSCKRLRLKDPVNLIRSAWIRPEDAHYYEKIGIDYLKIVDRSKDADFIMKVLNAYIKKSYKGNLADLFPLTTRNSGISGPRKRMRYLQYLFNPFILNLFRMKQILANPQLEIHLDNAALDGFIEFFVQGKCKHGLCDECGYCKELAKKAVKIDKQYQDKALFEYDKILESIVSGHPFRYF